MKNKKDEYLKSGASLNRLLKEYREYGSLVIAYDFDSTVHDYHNKGESYSEVIELLRRLKKANCYLICFTANMNRDSIESYLVSNDIPFDSINENPPFFQCDARKIYYNAMLDDRAGLMQVYGELVAMMTILNL